MLAGAGTLTKIVASFNPSKLPAQRLVQFASRPASYQVENVYAAHAGREVVAGLGRERRIVLVVGTRQNSVGTAGDIAIECADYCPVLIRERQAIHIDVAESHVVINAMRVSAGTQAGITCRCRQKQVLERIECVLGKVGVAVKMSADGFIDQRPHPRPT